MFGMIPPRPRLNVVGRGSGNAGVQGSGSGSSSIGPSGSQKIKEEGKGCGALDILCKLGEAWKNITQGKTIFGVPMTPFQGVRVPLVVP